MAAMVGLYRLQSTSYLVFEAGLKSLIDSSLKIWVLLDDRAGNRSQCMGVANALSNSYVEKELEYSPLSKLPSRILGASFAGLSKPSRKSFGQPWPDLVIAAGRRTAPVALKIKRLSHNHSKLVQIMWPGSFAIDEFDLVCVPNHDEVPDLENVFRITGAPSSINATASEVTLGPSADLFAKLPSPKIAVLCGGSTKNRQFTDTMATELGRAASTMALGSGGSLLVTTSRRTGTAVDALQREIHAPSHIHRWDDTGENPYRAYLTHADAIIVTGESISMCSEACSTGKPVYIYGPQNLVTEKHNRFLQELYGLGYARPLNTAFEKWTYQPLDAAGQIANQIRTRFSIETDL